MLEKFKIGHYTDETNGTGVTAIIAEGGAVAGVSVRGSAPATRETDLLCPEKTVERIDAVVLSGGSAFGLEASCGVMEYLYKKGYGYDAGGYRVPIVCGASIYDLEYKNFAYPDKAAGFKAAEDAKCDNFVRGSIGAGTGATVGKMCGMPCAAKAGIGTVTFELNGVEIAVIAVVNALGDVVENGKILAGPKAEDGSFLDSSRIMTAGSVKATNSNTTIGCVITNAKLSKVEANILADLAHDGLAKAVSPSHTRFDGDAFFCMASGEKSVEFNILTAIIPSLAEKAIQAAVKDNLAENEQNKVNKILFGVFQRMWKR